jgi:hypothetical protein
MINLVLCDPALREFGGHHPATLGALMSSQAVKTGRIKCEVYSHKDCSEEYVQLVQHKQLVFKRHFNTDFYQHFYAQTNIAELQPYIRQLTKEYLLVLNKVLTGIKQGDPYLFWFHTLNWQHAYALALALDAVKQPMEQVPVCVCLMYSPYRQSDAGGIDAVNALNFEIAFKYLNKFSNVQFYAADYELAGIYSKLLNNTVDIHPSMLLGDVAKPENIPKQNKIILFTGDAKPNKGFYQLPELVERLVNKPEFKDVEFVIQYTVTNNSSGLASIASCLTEMTKTVENLTVIDRFLPHSELLNMFATAKAILFNYDARAYQNQSSGVLWLAALYNLTVICLTDTWVNREASRLLVSCYTVNECNIAEAVQLAINAPAANLAAGTAKPADYATSLFKDVGNWLCEQYETFNPRSLGR